MAQVLFSLRHSGRVAVLRLSNPPVNGLSLPLRKAIIDRVAEAHSHRSVQALVLLGDGATFPAGADIAEFALGRDGPAFAQPHLPDVIHALEQSRLPVTAALHGTCLGGGLEMALGCHYRIAAPTARVGLPEVHLGLLPGAGGTQRLPRLTGVEFALQAMTSGAMVGASEALHAGILDEVLGPETCRGGAELEAAALAFVDARVLGKDAPSAEARRVSARPVPAGHSSDVFDEWKRRVSGGSTRGQTAPPAIVDAVRAAVEASSFEEGLAEEGRLFSDLFASPQAAAMQHMFFAERATGRGAVPKGVRPREVSRVGIVGCGTMGSGIAMAMLDAGIAVTVVDTTQEALDAGMQRIEATYKRSSKYRSGKLSDEALAGKLRLLRPSTSYGDLGDADIVIEAAFERMAVKKAIFAEIVRHARADAILATNTSTLDVDEIAESTGCPERVVGTHFFSPANVMKLLENVRGAKSSDQAVATVMALGKRIGKVPVLAGNCFGFIGNRMLEGYGQEAAFLVEEGASIAQVDKALTDFGMAMGFFTMCDLAGNDIGYSIRQDWGRTGPYAGRYPGVMDVIAEAGYFGQKTGKGWYLYEQGSRVPAPHPEADELIEEYRGASSVDTRTDITDEEILERMLYSLINEGFKVLEDGIAIKPSDIDVTWCYGYGFPRWRGGPMHYADAVGLPRIAEALTAYSAAHPDQPHLKPAKLLLDLVADGRSLKEHYASL